MMKTFGLRMAICLAVGFPLYSHAEGCEYDTQCKGDRICENKKCVSPQAATPSQQSAPTAKPAEHNAGVFGLFAKKPAPVTDAVYFCCTMSEKLGPYPNPGSDGKILKVGDGCSGITTNARTLPGKVCD